MCLKGFFALPKICHVHIPLPPLDDPCLDNSTGHRWRPRQRVRPSRPGCSGLSGIGSSQSRKKDLPPGTVDLTPRTRIAPLLLRLSWQDWPLFHSREHGWDVPRNTRHGVHDTSDPARFPPPADEALQALALHEGFMFTSCHTRM